MSTVLLLSSTYEPLRVISWQNAVGLFFMGKVEIIEEYDHEIVDRGYEDLTSFFVVKNGKPKLIYSNYNGDETCH